MEIEPINSLDIIKSMTDVSASVKTMAQSVANRMPKIQGATAHFGKRQSQFMDNMLTLSHPTPYRNLRQILSEIERSNEGLRESYFKREKLKIDYSNLENNRCRTHYDNLEMRKIKSDLDAGEKYIAGAVRKIHNYMDQYDSILAEIKKKHGVTELTEEIFEAEEEEYHIKTAYAQALTAARSRNGIIDEGNHIYFYQIGINGAVAQSNILGFLGAENELLKNGEYPSHEMILKFLDQVYLQHKGSSKVYAQSKMLKLGNKKSMFKTSTISLVEE